MTNERITEFYQQLGKIFYALAAVDKTVRQEEINTLNEIIRKEWLVIDDSYDFFGSDSVYQIEIVFDWLVENTWDISEVLSDFKIYKQENESLFNPKNNGLILKTADAIAKSFSGKNKSEQAFLVQLHKILNT